MHSIIIPHEHSILTYKDESEEAIYNVIVNFMETSIPKGSKNIAVSKKNDPIPRFNIKHPKDDRLFMCADIVTEYIITWTTSELNLEV